jgi:hypothetical protein
MSESEQPEWLKNYKPDSGIGNPKWHKGMRSPNPAGRPKGIRDKRLRVSQALLDAAEGVARIVIEEAKSGDMSAAALVLARVAPALKSQAERVNFDFDSKASLVEQVQSVLQGIADGNVAPDVGRHIIEAIASLSGIRAVEDLELRLSKLEQGGRR